MQLCKTPATIQRGDVVDVAFAGGSFQYRGIVRSSTKRHGVFVITRNSGYGYKPDKSSTSITVVERTGKRRFADIFEMSRQFA